MSDEDFDAELRRLINEEQTGEAGQVRETVLVNQPDRRGDDEPVWRAQVRARPVLPAWLRSTEELRAAAGWAWSYGWRTAAFHVIRLPAYAARLAGRSPVGAGKVWRRFSDWLFDAEGQPVRHAAVDRADAERYIKLRDRRDDRVRLRLIVSGLFAIPALAALLVLMAAPAVTRWSALAVVLGVLGWVGMPADKPLISRAVVPGRVQKLTDVLVERALGSLGIPAITAVLGPKGGGIDFPDPIARDISGWRAVVDLPHGVTVTDILERRDRLASGLRRPVGCVWPEPVHSEHPGRLVLWVG